jgi:hypothetical protein
MARVIPLARAAQQDRLHEVLRLAIVYGCALALISAGQPLPL